MSIIKCQAFTFRKSDFLSIVFNDQECQESHNENDNLELITHGTVAPDLNIRHSLMASELTITLQTGR